tara:strand:+ start:69 stop:383 length:315 start_codon:yes stop_codon:yes gene_type:complete
MKFSQFEHLPEVPWEVLRQKRALGVLETLMTERRADISKLRYSLASMLRSYSAQAVAKFRTIYEDPKGRYDDSEVYAPQGSGYILGVIKPTKNSAQGHLVYTHN